MEYIVEGKLIRKQDTQQVSEKFRKREFVVETTEQYPQKIKLEFTQDNCGKLDGYNEGDMVKVSFNLRGSEWQGKFFVNLQAWRIERAQAGAAAPASQEDYSFPTAKDEPVKFNDGGDGDDLPF